METIPNKTIMTLKTPFAELIDSEDETTPKPAATVMTGKNQQDNHNS